MGQNEAVLFGPVPEWAEASELMPVEEDTRGLVFVRRQDSTIHLDAEGQAQFSAFRMRILHPNALNAGNISLAWNPAVGAPTVHALKVYRGAEVIDVLATNDFQVLRREDQLERAMLEGLLTAVLQVPDLRVDDELEVALTTPMQDPTLGAESAGYLVLGTEPPPGRYMLRLSWEDGQRPGLRLSPDMAAHAKVEPQAVMVTVDDPASLAPPRGAPPRYGWQRLIEFSDSPAWADLSRRFAPLYAQAATLQAASPISTEAARIASAHQGELARAAAALELVQRQVRYIFVGLDTGGYTPASAEETWRRRYGDCKGQDRAAPRAARRNRHRGSAGARGQQRA